MPIKGGYLLLAGIGGVVAWSGLRGKAWSTVATDLIRGKPPTTAPTVNLISGSSASGSGGGNGFGGSGNSGSLVAWARDNMHRYHYVFGGAPKLGTVDCSSYMNEGAVSVGLPIPKFPPFMRGNAHGPATFQWRLTTIMRTVPESQAQAGDLIIWLTHMGVLTDNGKNMVSALNPQDGIRETPISWGPQGETFKIRRWR